MNKARNPLPPRVREVNIGVLNNTVADLFGLYVRTKQMHWNGRGTSFVGLRKLLGDFAARTMNYIDRAAERATTFGGTVEDPLRESMSHSQLKKQTAASSIGGMSGWIHELAEVHAACTRHVRAAIQKLPAAENFGTADLLTDIVRDLDFQCRLLKAHINQRKTAKKTEDTSRSYERTRFCS
jgi:starvation-inducible DNA-binding protein